MFLLQWNMLSQVWAGPGAPIQPLSFAEGVYSVREGVSPLQTSGIRVLPYLDDWLLLVPSQARAFLDTCQLLAHMSQLGLKLNLLHLSHPLPAR